VGLPCLNVARCQFCSVAADAFVRVRQKALEALLSSSPDGAVPIEQPIDVASTLGGATWTTLHHWLGYGGVAKLTCGMELALPALLALRATRRGAVIVAAAFHACISASMMVSTFGAEMLVLLLAFWPMERSAVIPRSPN
jgi:hypothetical protein